MKVFKKSLVNFSLGLFLLSTIVYFCPPSPLFTLSSAEARRVRFEDLVFKLSRIKGLLQQGERVVEVRVEDIFQKNHKVKSSLDLTDPEFLRTFAMSVVAPKVLPSLQAKILGQNVDLIGAVTTLRIQDKKLKDVIKKALDDSATSASADVLRAIEENFKIIVRGYEGSIGHPGERERETPVIGQIFNPEGEEDVYWIGDPVDGTSNASKNVNPSGSIHLFQRFADPTQRPKLLEVPDTRTLSIIVRAENEKQLEMIKKADIRWDRTTTDPNPVEYNLIENLKEIAEALGKGVKDLKISVGKGSRFDTLKGKLKKEFNMKDENFKTQEAMYEVKGVLEMFLGDKEEKQAGQDFKPDVVIGGMANEMVVASQIAKILGGYSWITFGTEEGLSSKVNNLNDAFNEGKLSEEYIKAYEQLGIEMGRVYTMDDVLGEGEGYVVVSSITGMGNILNPVQYNPNTGEVTVESLVVDPAGTVKKITSTFKGIQSHKLDLTVPLAVYYLEKNKENIENNGQLDIQKMANELKIDVDILKTALRKISEIPGKKNPINQIFGGHNYEFFDVVKKDGRGMPIIQTNKPKYSAIMLNGYVHRLGEWHVNAHLMIVDKDGNLLSSIEKRKKPEGKRKVDHYEISASGHLGVGESLDEGVYREAREEIRTVDGAGIDLKLLESWGGKLKRVFWNGEALFKKIGGEKVKFDFSQINFNEDMNAYVEETTPDSGEYTIKKDFYDPENNLFIGYSRLPDNKELTGLYLFVVDKLEDVGNGRVRIMVNGKSVIVEAGEKEKLAVKKLGELKQGYDRNKLNAASALRHYLKVSDESKSLIDMILSMIS